MNAQHGVDTSTPSAPSSEQHKLSNPEVAEQTANSAKQDGSTVNDTIPQLDGIDDALVSNPHSVAPLQENPSVSNLIAQFSLNQKKQLTGLAKHS